MADVQAKEATVVITATFKLGNLFTIVNDTFFILNLFLKLN
jgi:hypothetical protein